MMLNVLMLIACAISFVLSLISADWVTATWIANCAVWVLIAQRAEAS